MENALNKAKFYLPKSKISKKYLDKNHFLFSKIFSDKDNEVYYYRFTVWRYGNAGVLESEIRINTNNGEVNIGCYDAGTRNIYASWYARDIGNNQIVEQIDEKIYKEIERLGIKIKW